MMIRVAGLLSAGLAVALSAGCKGDDGLSCTASSACPKGHACVKNKCTQVCEHDGDCARGTHCDGELCIDGDRGGAPEITEVRGNSVQSCGHPTTGEDLGSCIGTGFVVLGTGLAGSEWYLVSAQSGDSIALHAVGTQRNTEVELRPTLPPGQDDLEEGSYRLLVSNAAGDDQADVTLLRGEPGLPGTDGIDGEPGLPGGQAALFLYDNVSDADPAEGLPKQLDRMHLRLDAPTGEAMPATLPIDDERLMALCGDDDGCDVTLGAVGWVERARTRKTPRMSMPCRIFIRDVDGERHWGVASACVQWHGTWGATGWDGDSGDPGFYTPYFSNLIGVDGVDDIDGVLTDGPDDRGYVLNHERACFFAETTPATSAEGEWNADNDQGFYLVASGAAWDDGNNANGMYYPTPNALWPPAASGRSCEMTVED